MVSCPYWLLVKQGLHRPLVTGSGNPIRPAPMGARAATPHHTDWTDQHDGMIARGKKTQAQVIEEWEKCFVLTFVSCLCSPRKLHTYKSRKWKCSMLWVICVKKCKILQMTLILSLRLLIFISMIGDNEETLRKFEKISEKYWAKLCLVVRNREHLQCIAFFALLAPT